jgi:hypothetical protein
MREQLQRGLMREQLHRELMREQLQRELMCEQLHILSGTDFRLHRFVVQQFLCLVRVTTVISTGNIARDSL